MINVVFASRNGEQTIGLTLRSFLEIDPPDDGWVLIIVDNGSTDKTQSLSLALEHLNGDLVVFTDDDVIARPTWLRAFCAVATALLTSPSSPARLPLLAA